MTTPELDSLLETAVAAATAAGDHARTHTDRRHEVEARHAHDVKLKLDFECQERAAAVIARRYPHHPILGEEGVRGAVDEELVWIVDPLDGTVNFMHGMPWWCSAVAVRHQGEVVAGAVYVPALGACYAAAADRPAVCNGQPIGVSSTGALDHSLIVTGLSRHAEDPVALTRFRALTVAAQKVRVMGAAAVDICHVACGRADGYYESSIYLWDWAAAGLIARQAGATVEILEWLDEQRCRYLCTNGRIHKELKGLVTG